VCSPSLAPQHECPLKASAPLANQRSTSASARRAPGPSTAMTCSNPCQRETTCGASSSPGAPPRQSRASRRRRRSASEARSAGRACSAAVAGIAAVLAAGLIRGDLQAHLAVARLAEQPPSSTPTLAAGPDEREQSWRRPAAAGRRLLVFVPPRTLGERRSGACSLEKAEVELEHDERELHYRIARRRGRLAAGAPLTAQIRPEQAPDRRCGWLPLAQARRVPGVLLFASLSGSPTRVGPLALVFCVSGGA
jgi:hypothetical protein